MIFMRLNLNYGSIARERIRMFPLGLMKLATRNLTEPTRFYDREIEGHRPRLLAS